MKRKLPEMPVLPPKDGVQRRNVYTRLNPNGHEETVVKRQGKPDEETLNELADDLLAMIESVSFGQDPALSAEQPVNDRVVNQPSPPQLVASRGDPARAAGETLTNMTVSPSTQGSGFGSDGPELSRLRSPLAANAGGETPISKYNQGSVNSESFVGTGAIAFVPNALGSQPPSKKRRRSENKDTTTNRLESRMSTRRTINEWLPPFKANGYNPGEHTMPEPAGKGVADRTPTQDKVGAYDTDLSGVGKEWPRDGGDTEAMDRVDDEHISNSASGAHESTHGEPDDGHQKKLGHDWPKQPKNSGQGVAEPFGGDRWSDGGTLPQGRGPGSDTWTHTEGPGMPSEGPITGTDGPQLGHVSEGWNPDTMARLMGEDLDVQGLFNSYARSASAVCVEDFQGLLDAHGTGIVIDESSLLNLMDVNAEFMFHQGRDADGPYWVPSSILEEGENRRPFKGKTLNEDLGSLGGGMKMGRGLGGPDEMPGQGDGPVDIDGLMDPESLSPLSGPDELGGMDELGGAGEMGGMDELGMGGGGHEMDMDLGGMGGGAGGIGEMGGMGLECPGCGYQGEDAECPECGVEMMETTPGGQGAVGDPVGDELGLGGPGPGPGQGPVPPMESRSRQILTGPQIVASLKNFMESARSLIERNPKAKSRDLAEALNHSWDYHAGQVNARTCPTKVQDTLQGLMKRYPGFSPLVENQAMDKPEGTKLGGGDGPKENLPKQPTEMTTHGDKSLLGRHQKNNLEGTPTVAGTGKGLTGRSVSESAVAGGPGQAPGARAVGGVVPSSRPAAPPKQVKPPVPAKPQATGVATQQMQENVNRLAAHVKRAISEGARALGKGKYTTQFSILVAEGKPAFLKGKEEEKGGKGKKPPFGKDKKDAKGGKDKKGGKPDFLKKTRTPKRDNLAEALADAEEILQLHNPADVTFETTFFGPNGHVALKQDIPLFTINSRGPMVGEGKALFRFHRNAEAFADQLVEEGVTCRVVSHNWGSAVEARTDYRSAARAFVTLAESGAGCGGRRK